MTETATVDDDDVHSVLPIHRSSPCGMVGKEGGVWTHTSRPGAPLTAAKRRTFITRDGHLDLGNLSSEHGHPLAQTPEPHGIYHPTRASSRLPLSNTHTNINIHIQSTNVDTAARRSTLTKFITANIGRSKAACLLAW
ncbi:hypothetical protein CBL_00286 [Carabus blaptoides fortunei]